MLNEGVLALSIGDEFASQLSACCCFCPGFWFLMWRRSDGFLSGEPLAPEVMRPTVAERFVLVWLVFVVAAADFLFYLFIHFCTRCLTTCPLTPFLPCFLYFSPTSFSIVGLECARVFLNPNIRAVWLKGRISHQRRTAESGAGPGSFRAGGPCMTCKK